VPQLSELNHLSSAEKDALIHALWAQVQSLTARVAALEAKLNEPSKNPDNSSLPPSKGQMSTPETKCSGAPDVAEAHRPAPPQPILGGAAGGANDKPPGMAEPPSAGPTPPPADKKPARFTGAVMISSDRPARDMHQIVEAIVEQLTTLPGSKVKLRLEIDAEIASGLDRANVRTLVENANTLNFIEKSVD
jgi:hypothetical protein